jgi:hypothetical protein
VSGAAPPGPPGPPGPRPAARPRTAGVAGAAPGGELALARAVAAAVGGVPGVAALTPGRFAEAATYGPGEVVRGVAVWRRPGGWAVEVHVRAVYAPALPLPALADRVRRAAGAAAAALGAGPAGPIDVAVDDLAVEEPPARQPDRQGDPARGRGEA